jgi:hypothetical protein
VNVPFVTILIVGKFNGVAAKVGVFVSPSSSTTVTSAAELICRLSDLAALTVSKISATTYNNFVEPFGITNSNQSNVTVSALAPPSSTLDVSNTLPFSSTNFKLEYISLAVLASVQANVNLTFFNFIAEASPAFNEIPPILTHFVHFTYVVAAGDEAT